MFYSADCAFAEFDRFFVWGRHFEELFTSLGHDARRLAIAGSPDHRTLFRQIREAEQPRGNSVLLVHNSVVTRLDSPDLPVLRRLLRLLPPGWTVRVRSHPAANATLARYVSALKADPVLRSNGLRIAPEPFESILLSEALRRSRIVAGVYSTALLEGWVAGCKLVYLPGVIAREAVLPRHGGSPNVLYLDASVSDAAALAFLSTPATLDGAEAIRVDRVTHVLGSGKRFATFQEVRSAEPLSA
jgi:prepilin-type processing-associated H-X9-DG protein